jgi:hypothetical protein
VQAEARREAGAARFRVEQEQAARSAREREAAEREQKGKVAEQLMNELYGSFKR